MINGILNYIFGTLQNKEYSRDSIETVQLLRLKISSTTLPY